MITVKITDGAVSEIVPEYALPPEKWYSAEFAAHCVVAPDNVAYGWIYDPETGMFNPPPDPPTPEPTPDVNGFILGLMEGIS